MGHGRSRWKAGTQPHPMEVEGGPGVAGVGLGNEVRRRRGSGSMGAGLQLEGEQTEVLDST